MDPISIAFNALSLFGASKSQKQARKAQNLAAEQAAAQLALQKEQMALLEAQRERYRQFEFTLLIALDVMLESLINYCS